MSDPSAQRIAVRGLDYNVLTWEPPADVSPSGLSVLLIHGWADAGRSWRWVAPRLAQRGHLVIAPDLRGFGESEWVPDAAYYHFPDYIADLDALLRQLAPPRLSVIGHSMGGTVATLLTATRPSVERLAILEGVGPPDNEPGHAPDRMARWLADLAGHRARTAEKTLGSLDDVVSRLVMQHPRVSRDVLRICADHLAVQRVDGRYAWRFDPLHRTTSPMPFFSDVFKAFAARIEAPTLVVGGGPLGYHPQDEDERIASYRRVVRRELPEAGHMMHWTAPDELSTMLGDFIDGALDPEPLTGE